MQIVQYLNQCRKRTIDYLSRNYVIRKELLFILFWSRCHGVISRTYAMEYLRVYNSKQDDYRRLYYNNNNNNNSNRQQTSTNSPYSSLIYRLFSNSWQQANSIAHHLPTGVPKMWLYFRIQELISSLYMTYVLIKFFLPLDWLCYLPGRIVHSSILYRLGAFLICGFHLAWRILHQYIYRTFKFDFITFMLQRDEDVHRQYKLLANMDQKGHLEPLKPINQAQRAQDEYMKSIMCYPMRDEKLGIIYRLRSNRTEGSRKKLANHIANLFLFSSISFYSVIGIAQFFVIHEAASDFHYLRHYSNCTKNLDYQPTLEEGEFCFRKSFDNLLTFNGHRIISFLFDFLETNILLVDSYAVMFEICFVEILTFDLVEYVSEIDLKLKHLLQLLKYNWFIENSSLDYEINRIKSTTTTTTTTTATTTIRSNNKTNLYKRGEKYETQQQKYTITNFIMNHKNIEIDNFELEIQSELQDLFKRIGEVDSIASESCSIGLLAWLGTCTSISYYIALHLVQGKDLAIFRFFQFFAMVIFHGLCLVILNLRHHTLKMNQRICSIMAYTKPKHKMQFLRLSAYYDEPDRASYTIFNGRPFKQSTYLQILGWTFSSSFIIESLISGYKQR